jgi:Domain of unknown function (DUF4105)
MKWLFSLLVMISVCAEAAVIDYPGIGPLNEVIQETLSELPTDFLDSVKTKVKIQEIPFRTDHLLENADLCRINESVKFGYTKKYDIFVSSKLVVLAKDNLNAFDCGHKTFRNLLKAVLIHELTHVKDNQEKISLDPDFQRIVGMKRVTLNSRKKLLNQNTISSPDAYEFKNLEEALAVNTEFLVLDSEFECRKPATANFLSKRLNFPLRGRCQKNHKIIVQSAFLEDNYRLPVSIDPRRIYQIHYLFAGKGRALMSRWGHAMFRLVICAPLRKTPGPACLDDVSHHLVLSYRAYMSDIKMSYAKGVMGGYPSQLFILRYLEVQQEYTKFELRDMYSIPLKMSSVQKIDFIDLTLERYWTYQGKYYFLDNNCGTETVKHLEVALSPDEEKLIGSITPLKIYNDIIKNSQELSDENLRHLSKQELIEKRILVQSMANSLNESYQFLRGYMPSFREPSLHKFMKKTKASLRLADYENFIKGAQNVDPELRKQVSIKMIHVERYLANKFLQGVPKKAIELMNKDEELKQEVMKMGQSFKLLSLQPWEVIKGKYGIPLNDEFEHQYPLFLNKYQEETRLTVESQMNNLQEILGKRYFENELNELEDLKKIKRVSSDLINQLSKI